MIYFSAVPMSKHFPQPLMEYYVNDCSASVLVTTEKYSSSMGELAKKTNKKLIIVEDNDR